MIEANAPVQNGSQRGPLFAPAPGYIPNAVERRKSRDCETLSSHGGAANRQ